MKLFLGSHTKDVNRFNCLTLVFGSSLWGYELFQCVPANIKFHRNSLVGYMIYDEVVYIYKGKLMKRNLVKNPFL